MKAGQGHFKNLLKQDEQTYNELMEQEIVISEYIRYTKQPHIKSGKQKDHMLNDVYEFVSNGIKTDKIKNILRQREYHGSKMRRLGVDGKNKPIKKPYTFNKTKSLLEMYKDPRQLDLFDIGGCGCFVDYE